jgi:hypothetical protein
MSFTRVFLYNFNTAIRDTTMTSTSSNCIFAIRPYRWNGLWVFDDPAVGLVKEPFVSGIPEMIDAAVSKIPNAEESFVAVFSANPFPGAQLILKRARQEMGGDMVSVDRDGPRRLAVSGAISLLLGSPRTPVCAGPAGKLTRNRRRESPSSRRRET